MRKKNRLFAIFMMGVLGLFLVFGTRLFAVEADHEQESETEHLDADHAVREVHEDEEPVRGHDDDGETVLIHLDPKSEQLINVKTVQAQPGSLDSVIRLSGRIRMNQDKLAHIVPLTSGIVRQVNVHLGDSVEKGDILAWIESLELAQAKVKYLDIQAEIGCCTLNLTRAKVIYDATQKLTDLLKTNPSLDDLTQLNGLEMGENRSKLVKAYAEYTIARSSYEREKPLYEQNITSKEEFLDAANRYKKAEAEYMTMLDTVQFQTRQNLLEVQGDQNRQEIALEGIRRTLYILGQTDEDIERLDVLASNPTGGQQAEDVCTDPNCEECLNKAESAAQSKGLVNDYEKLGWYPLQAGFDGLIIDKHITLGERLSEETVAFTIADLETVWVDFDVFPKDLPSVKEGQTVYISGETQKLKSELAFVSPILNPETRTAAARVILDNSKRNLYPGQFVTAQLNRKTQSGRIVIPIKAVQTIDGNRCVFIKTDDEYELRHVTVGQSGQDMIEVTSGLQEGESVVTDGAFELKTKIVTSTLDSHAGHGH